MNTKYEQKQYSIISRLLNNWIFNMWFAAEYKKQAPTNAY